MRLLKTLTLSAALLLTLSAAHAASGIEQLRQFMQGAQSAKAGFTQIVINKTGKAGQKSTGTMSFLRPGKFLWTYEKPYNQIMIGDGVKFWSYDKDLNQVIVKPIGEALGSSPVALLAGDNNFEKNFTVTDAATSQDGLNWIEALPKSKEAGFERVRIGLKDGLPQAMEVLDAFGQTTQLQFINFERNPKLAADAFKFTPPKGADVIGE